MTVREQLGAALFAGALVGALGAAVGVALGVASRGRAGSLRADLGAGYFRGIAPQLAVHPLEVATFFALGSPRRWWRRLAGTRAASVPAAVALKAATRRHCRSAAQLGRGSACGRRGGALLLPPLEGIALPGYTAIACCCSRPCSSRRRCRTWRSIGCRPRPGVAADRDGAVARTARRSTVSIAAVLVSFSLMVAMAIMVYSFRNSLDAWMQRILPADLYVRAGSRTHQLPHEEAQA